MVASPLALDKDGVSRGLGCVGVSLELVAFPFALNLSLVPFQGLVRRIPGNYPANDRPHHRKDQRSDAGTHHPEGRRFVAAVALHGIFLRMNAAGNSLIAL